MKALIVGLGGVGQRHLRNLLDLVPGISIAALRHRGRAFEIGDDLRADYSVDITRKYNLTVFADRAAALDWQPDFAIVANPSHLHAETALSCVERGIPVLVEKPVATKIDDALRLASASEEHDVLVMAAYTLQYNPSVARLRDAIARVGAIYAAHVACHNFLPFSHPYESIDEFYLGRRDLGGGVILSEIHSMELMNSLFGMPARVWARGGRRSDLAIDVEDTVSALCEYPDFPVSIHISMVERPVQRHIRVYGEQGCLDWDFMRTRLAFNDEILFEDASYRYVDMFKTQLSHFLDCLRTGAEPVTSLRRTLGAQAIAAAMADSLGSGAVKTIPHEVIHAC